MTTRWEPYNQSNVWEDPMWVEPEAWDTAWAAWVSELPVRTDCPIRYALLHLLRYDRARGIVPVTSTTRFFLRYTKPNDWQGSKEEYLWCIEQYINWLTTRYGNVSDWTAWALPAMFTEERIEILQQEGVGRHHVMQCTAWQSTTGFAGADTSSDDTDGTESQTSSISSGDWNTAPVGEPDAEGEPLPEACRPRPKAN